MHKAIFVFVSFLFLSLNTWGQIDLRQPFEDQGVKGSITLFDYKNQKWIASDSTDTSIETVPASTFKIINLLIALETGVISSELDTIRWVGKIDTSIYGYRPSTYKDMTVKEAFEVSAGWVFMELSKKIGKERYLHYLQLCDYGNKKVSDEVDFWNFGPLNISPRQQIEFLIKVHENQLPFSKRNIDILKKVMINEKNDRYILRAKTGWGWSNGTDAGWWVGYVEKGENVFFFATRLTKAREDKNKNFQSARLGITKGVLGEMGVL